MCEINVCAANRNWAAGQWWPFSSWHVAWKIHATLPLLCPLFSLSPFQSKSSWVIDVNLKLLPINRTIQSTFRLRFGVLLLFHWKSKNQIKRRILSHLNARIIHNTRTQSENKNPNWFQSLFQRVSLWKCHPADNSTAKTPRAELLLCSVFNYAHTF